MNKDRESKLRELGDRLKLGMKYASPRFGIPPFAYPENRFAWMMKEHEDFRERTDACLEYWMAHTDFESHEDEEPIRQAYWRLLAAADWLSIGAEVILDHEPDQTPDGILRQMLFDSWLPDSSFPSESFQNFAEGRTMFQRDWKMKNSESGRREILTPAPHTTGHTDP